MTHTAYIKMRKKAVICIKPNILLSDILIHKRLLLFKRVFISDQIFAVILLLYTHYIVVILDLR